MKPRYARSELRFLLEHRHTGEPYQGPLIETGNADTVDYIHASTYPAANQLLALDANAQFPDSVYPNALLLDGSRPMVGSLDMGDKEILDVAADGDLTIEPTGDRLNFHSVSNYIDSAGNVKVSGKVTSVGLDAGTGVILASGGTNMWPLDIRSTVYGGAYIRTSASGTLGAYLRLLQESSSPAAGDRVGIIQFLGNDAGLNITQYAGIECEISTTTDLAEGGELVFDVMSNGTVAEALRIHEDLSAEFQGSVACVGLDATTGAIKATGAQPWPINVRSSDAGAGIVLTNTYAGADGNVIWLRHLSSSPAAGDRPGTLVFSGRDAGLASTRFASIAVEVTSVTDLAEGGELSFSLMSNGAMSEALRLHDDLHAEFKGSVGIGVSPPSHPLHIEQNLSGDSIAKIRNLSNTGYSTLLFADDAGTVRGSIGFANSGATAAPDHVYIYHYYKDFIFRTSKNIGINKVNPGQGSTGTATRALHFANGSAPSGTLTEGALFYASAGEMYVYDAAGNATLLSPHDPKTGEWIFYTKNTRTGRVLKVYMERLMQKLKEIVGDNFFEEFTEVAA